MVEGVSADAGQDQPPGVPRWVKLLGVALAVLVIALVAAMLVLGGDHGPGRHF